MFIIWQPKLAFSFNYFRFIRIIQGVSEFRWQKPKGDSPHENMIKVLVNTDAFIDWRPRLNIFTNHSSNYAATLVTYCCDYAGEDF